MCSDLENELVRFPASTHDDVSDATAYQVQIAKAMDSSFDFDEFAVQELSSSQKYGMILEYRLDFLSNVVYNSLI